MMLVTLPLMIAAVSPAPQSAARELVSASVQIIAAEEIRFADIAAIDAPHTSSKKITQQRVRDFMPMIEFY